MITARTLVSTGPAVALLVALSPMSVQAAEPAVEASFVAETEADSALEAAIRAEISPGPEDTVRYFYNRVDLNGDSRLPGESRSQPQLDRFR